MALPLTKVDTRPLTRPVRRARRYSRSITSTIFLAFLPRQRTTWCSKGSVRACSDVRQETDGSPNAGRTLASKFLFVICQPGKAAVLVAHSRDRPSRTDLVFHLNRLTFGRGYIGGEGHKQRACHALLDGNARARILSIVGAKRRINLQLRDSRNLGYLAA